MPAVPDQVKLGLFGIGLDTYWPQFRGLRDKLVGYQDHIRMGLEKEGVQVVDAGLVDNLDSAAAAARLFAGEGVELIFLYISTYALSSTVLPVVQKTRVPVVVLNLQPSSRIDYAAFNKLPSREEKTGEWLAHCQACSVPEIASVFNRAGIAYHLVTGALADPVAWAQMRQWAEAARVARVLGQSRIGLLGHYYAGMLDVYSDYAQLAGIFGNHFELMEMDELKALRDATTPQQVAAMRDEFERTFMVSPECLPAELDRAASTSAALHQLAERHRLGGMAYYYEGQPGNEHEDIATSVIAGNTLLTAHHVPVAGEYEVKNAMAMKIMDLLGAGGSFSEFYGLDLDDDIVLLGHDGPAHAAIAQGRVQLVPLQVYHGKPGKGLSVQMSVKNGPVTVLSVCQDRQGRVKLLAAQGESVPGPVLEIGNTNSRYRFSIGAKAYIDTWAKAGPSHHCAIGLGHVAGTLEKFALLLGIEFQQVC
ncbi:MAG: L-fucose/L-arabinose isomerase family protein [Candidatus Handelsmanbacteria bacterium]|nr:L-fucose/L-arabinose isomerase family protein [Candidatus Handelsmanbacteria bacterium]